MNKLYLHTALILCTGLLTGLTLILNANLNARLDQLPGVQATTAPTPTITPGSPYEPTLNISFREGAPGSIFSFTGLGYEFLPSDSVIITINGQSIGTIVGSSGWYVFLLDTKDAEDGIYMVHVQTPGLEKTESFRLDPSEPIRQPIISGPKYTIPAGIAFKNQELLPAVMR